jgi:hypothetical protein
VYNFGFVNQEPGPATDPLAGGGEMGALMRSIVAERVVRRANAAPARLV